MVTNTLHQQIFVREFTPESAPTAVLWREVKKEGRSDIVERKEEIIDTANKIT